ncbi:MAG: methyltransferase domain-containing protein [Candidatus Wallbacteria bacterium]|nr:methyltransferase domain-containing protein [Candidatus Wallbacteria bacterium]
MTYDENRIFHTPPLTRIERRGIALAIDGDTPNWIATDVRGSRLLTLLDGKRPFGEVVREYAAREGVELSRAWIHADWFVRALERQGLAAPHAFSPAPYSGRASTLALERLSELWLHTNNSCNLQCTHCLVSSGPGGDKGLPGEKLVDFIAQAHRLGTRRFYFTGGEPFARKDIFELIALVTEELASELIVLTNATLFEEERLEKLGRVDRQRLRLQVSLDGATAAVNDRLRGEGSFETICAGLRTAARLGFPVTVTSVVTRDNLSELPGMVALTAEEGVSNLHLMWLHRRGRAVDRGASFFPSTSELVDLTRRVKTLAAQAGVQLDNTASARYRVNGRPGARYDLGNQAWESLCIYSDGRVYPSAALANHRPLCCGDALEQPLERIWRDGHIARELREATVLRKSGAHADFLKYFTGGGDVEHSYIASEARHGKGSFLAEDPYYELARELVLDAMFELAAEGRAATNMRSGHNAPPVYHAMGAGSVVCGADDVDVTRDYEVRTLHSNCVLGFDVERPHRLVQQFYGEAAQEPKPGLCCPESFAKEDVSHIPEAVQARAFGCGSPVSLAGVREGETIVDLGSGGGIDCFIAARKTGPAGAVIGVDMTEKMLQVANENLPLVAANLGYTNVEFRKGFLEKVPVDSRSVDLVTSNCVINLSPDKRAVLSEIWRMLKDHGRLVVSDIVSEGPIPSHLKVNSMLWGECLGGALAEDELLGMLEAAGFHGISLLKKSFWQEVAGYRFHSVTVRGYKFEKKAGCDFIGQWAIYQGPYKAVLDEEGHLFPRGEAVEVCTDTFARLAQPPYIGAFTLVGDGAPAGAQPAAGGEACCAPGGACC